MSKHTVTLAFEDPLDAQRFVDFAREARMARLAMLPYSNGRPHYNTWGRIVDSLGAATGATQGR